MTSMNRYAGRNRDQQDHIERHVWGEIEYVDEAGAVIRVKGTGTEDEEAVVLNQNSGFNLAKDSDAEVVLLAGASDTNQKFALLQLPHKTQRAWGEGSGGIQHPNNGGRAVEINDEMTHAIDRVVHLHVDGVVKVTDGLVTIDGDLIVNGDITVNGDVEINGKLAVSDDVSIGGNLNVAGIASAAAHV